MRSASKNVWTQKDIRNTETFIDGGGCESIRLFMGSERKGVLFSRTSPYACIVGLITFAHHRTAHHIHL